jgi:hypothetical protein
MKVADLTALRQQMTPERRAELRRQVDEAARARASRTRRTEDSLARMVAQAEARRCLARIATGRHAGEVCGRPEHDSRLCGVHHRAWLAQLKLELSELTERGRLEELASEQEVVVVQAHRKFGTSERWQGRSDAGHEGLGAERTSSGSGTRSRPSCVPAADAAGADVRLEQPAPGRSRELNVHTGPEITVVDTRLVIQP